MYVVKQDMICLRRGLASLTQGRVVVEDEAQDGINPLHWDNRREIREISIGMAREQGTKPRPKRREHENCKCAFDRALGRSFGCHVDITSLCRREERSYFKVSRTGSTTVSATHPRRHGGESRQVIQSVYGCRRLPTVAPAGRAPGLPIAAPLIEPRRPVMARC